jgi:hypothetical protein
VPGAIERDVARSSTSVTASPMRSSVDRPIEIAMGMRLVPLLITKGSR